MSTYVVSAIGFNPFVYRKSHVRSAVDFNLFVYRKSHDVSAVGFNLFVYRKSHDVSAICFNPDFSPEDLPYWQKVFGAINWQIPKGAQV